MTIFLEPYNFLVLKIPVTEVIFSLADITSKLLKFELNVLNSRVQSNMLYRVFQKSGFVNIFPCMEFKKCGKNLCMLHTLH